MLRRLIISFVLIQKIYFESLTSAEEIAPIIPEAITPEDSAWWFDQLRELQGFRSLANSHAANVVENSKEAKSNYKKTVHKRIQLGSPVFVASAFPLIISLIVNPQRILNPSLTPTALMIAEVSFLIGTAMVFRTSQGVGGGRSRDLQGIPDQLANDLFFFVEKWEGEEGARGLIINASETRLEELERFITWPRGGPDSRAQDLQKWKKDFADFWEPLEIKFNARLEEKISRIKISKPHRTAAVKLWAHGARSFFEQAKAREIGKVIELVTNQAEELQAKELRMLGSGFKESPCIKAFRDSVRIPVVSPTET